MILRRAREVVIASIQPGIRDRGQFGRVDDANNLGQHSEGVAEIGNTLAAHNTINCNNFAENNTVKA